MTTSDVHDQLPDNTRSVKASTTDTSRCHQPSSFHTLTLLALLTVSLLLTFLATITVFTFVVLVLQNLWSLRDRYPLLYKVPWLVLSNITKMAQRAIVHTLVDGRISKKEYWTDTISRETDNWELRKLRLAMIGGMLALAAMVLGRVLTRRWTRGTKHSEGDEESRVWLARFDVDKFERSMGIEDPTVHWRKKRS